MGRSQQAIRIAEDMVSAAQLAEEKFSDSEMEVRQSHKLRAGNESGKLAVNGRTFTWKKSIAPYSDEDLKDETKMNTVAVSVEWKAANRNNQMQIESLILNREKQA
jgi:hypothetical protein